MGSAFFNKGAGHRLQRIIIVIDKQQQPSLGVGVIWVMGFWFWRAGLFRTISPFIWFRSDMVFGPLVHLGMAWDTHGMGPSGVGGVIGIINWRPAACTPKSPPPALTCELSFTRPGISATHIRVIIGRQADRPSHLSPSVAFSSRRHRYRRTPPLLIGSAVDRQVQSVDGLPVPFFHMPTDSQTPSPKLRVQIQIFIYYLCNHEGTKDWVNKSQNQMGGKKEFKFPWVDLETLDSDFIVLSAGPRALGLARKTGYWNGTG
ncbi:hypothetical protein VTI74DRAFT_7602 [Chaetomium olivicolor]